MSTATAIAHPNIALVKYWGKRDLALNLPAVGSLSLTLDGFHTRTSVTWGAPRDHVSLDGSEAAPPVAAKVLRFLDLLDAKRPPCAVVSHNDFPTGAGLASSASAFAALGLAASHAAGRTLTGTELSVWARQGSGSACRSVDGGFVVWDRGTRDDGLDSHARALAGQDHWAVSMVVAVVSTAKKAVGSTEGMLRTAASSPLYATWLAQAEHDLAVGERAVLERDLDGLGRVMEASTYKMHATMMTAQPPLLYWQPGSVACLQAVWALREAGTSAWTTMDAGPQVKVLCRREDAETVASVLRPHAQAVHILGPGGPARIET